MSIKIEKDDDQFTKHESSKPSGAMASNSDDNEEDIKPQRSRSPSQT